MSEFVNGLLAALVLIGVAFVAFGFGMEFAITSIIDNCASYGTAKINGKLYECRLE